MHKCVFFGAVNKKTSMEVYEDKNATNITSTKHHNLRIQSLKKLQLTKINATKKKKGMSVIFPY